MQRLEDTTLDAETILATDGEGVAGFIHVVFDEDSRWGALIDNLHVRHAHGRSGVGSRLMAEAASAVLRRPRTTGLHLWVLERNEPARAFYDALGGRCVERGFVMAPGGDPTRLNGTPAKLRYVWDEPGLLTGRRGHPTR